MNRSILKNFDFLESKFTFLLVSLLIFIIVVPLVGEYQIGQTLLVIFTLLILIAVVFAIRKRKFYFYLFSTLTIFNLIFSLFALEYKTIVTLLLSNGIDILMLGLAALIFTQEIMTSKKVTKDILYGSICVYCLAALAYGVIYQTIELLIPGSFIFTSPANNPQMQSSDFFYFSFITLTTVGYGDIAVLKPFARSIVIIESVNGIFYLATLVAALVAKYTRN